MAEEDFVWEWDKESIPLEDIGDPGPPTFVGATDKHSTDEGENFSVTFQVTGNPAPEVEWNKGFKKIDAEEKMRNKFQAFTRGGPGEKNIIGLFVKEAKPDEEGDYRVFLRNEHGEEEYEFKIYVTVAGGMDFRAMLMKKKKKKAPPGPPPIEWIEKPVDISVQEKTDPKAMFAARLSEKGKVGKWFLLNQRTREARQATENGLEITKKDKDYEIAQVDDCYTLTINNPKKEHMGRYTIVVPLGKESKTASALLDVRDANPEFMFKLKLDEEAKGLTNRPLTLYTRINQPGATVKWTKGGQDLDLSSGKYELVKGGKSDQEFNLIIKACTLDDTGLYTCELQEFVKPGEDSETSCIVTVEEYPHTFTSKLKGQDVLETDEAAFEIDCEAEDAEVTWYQNGKPIREDDPRFTIIKKGKKRKLVLKAAQLSDSGDITVKTNVDKSECALNVHIENRIVKGLPASFEGVEREYAEFPIELRDPLAPVEVLVNGFPIDGDRIQLENLGGGKHLLKVNKWAMTDDGTIELKTPSNRGNYLTSTCNTTMIKGEGVPQLGDLFQKDADGNNTQLGDCGPVIGIAGDDCSWNLGFKCEGVQQSPLEVVVIKDGRELVIGKDINVNLSDGKIDLSVINPTRAKSGVYTVVLKNAQGETRKDINVDILDKPTPPRNIKVTDVFYDNCIVHWGPPVDDGGCDITSYIVEAIDMTEAFDTSEKSSEWTAVGETQSGEDRSMYCPNLRHGHVYKFRVRAVNRLGKSDPGLLPGDGILIKDPWDEPGPPGRPTCLDWGPQSCDLEWPPPESDGGAPITAYEIEFLELGSNPQWAHGVTIPVEEMRMENGKLRGCCPGLIEGCEYQFRIKAINKGGPSLPSPPSEPPILAMNRFIEPFVKQPGMHDITVKKGRSFCFDLWFGGEPAPTNTWLRKNKPLFHDSETLTLELYSKKGTYTERNAILTVPKSDRLRDTGKYTFLLESSSGVCESSGFVNVLDVPGPPKDFVVKQVFPDKVTFAWQPPEDDGGQPIKHYQIRMMDFDTGEWHIAGDFDSLGGTVSGLKPGKCYEFEIVAVNKEGESLATKIQDPVFTLEGSKRPSPPLNPGVVDYDRSKALLEWTKPQTDGGYAITHYRVEKKETTKDSWCEAAYVPVRDCEQVDEFRFRVWLQKLQNGKWYEFRVYAENRAGLSDPSAKSPEFLCRPKDAAPCIDKSQGGPRITRENRAIDWRILITGHPTPEVRWGKNDNNSIDDHRVIQRNETDFDGLIACLSVAKCKKSDAGLYKLTAENALGSDSIEIDLIVLDDLDGCDCAMFSEANLDCTCRHRRLDQNVKQLLQDFGLQMEIEQLMNNAGNAGGSKF